MFTLDEMARTALAAAAHIRAEADYIRSWTDGRRGTGMPTTPGYIARRIEVAEECEAWAEAIEGLAAVCAPTKCEG